MDDLRLQNSPAKYTIFIQFDFKQNTRKNTREHLHTLTYTHTRRLAFDRDFIFRWSRSS